MLMALYTYGCRDCGYSTDIRHGMTEEYEANCPECDGGDYRKVIRAVSVKYKGSGFATNDLKEGYKAPPKPADWSPPSPQQLSRGVAPSIGKAMGAK